MSFFTSGAASSEVTLERLCAQAALGHEDAFDRLYERTAGELFGLAYVQSLDTTAAASAVAQSYTDLLGQSVDGGSVADVRTELFTNAINIANVLADDDRREVDAVRDPVAAGALRRLTPAQRSGLYLIDVLRMDAGAVAEIMDMDGSIIRQAVRTARASFRSTYVARSYDGADGSPECRSARNLLVPYSGRSLNAGDTLAVEQHLAACSTCRTVVARLDDIDARIRRAIPTTPVWMHQMAADAVPATPTADDLFDEEERTGAEERAALFDFKAFAVAAAVTALIGLTGISVLRGDTDTVRTAAVVTTTTAPTTIAPTASVPATVPTSQPAPAGTIAPAEQPADTDSAPSKPQAPQTPQTVVVVRKTPMPQAPTAASPPPTPTTAAPQPSYNLQPAPTVAPRPLQPTSPTTIAE